MLSRAWHNCRPRFSRALGCPDRYGAKSKIGISASASSRGTAEKARLIGALFIAERPRAGPVRRNLIRSQLAVNGSSPVTAIWESASASLPLDPRAAFLRQGRSGPSEVAAERPSRTDPGYSRFYAIGMTQ